MWRCVHQWGSPKYFYRLSGRLIPYFAILFSVFLIYGLVGGLYLAPPDYQQGDGFRIIYVHVPCAFLSLGVYLFSLGDRRAMG